jgi:hypothetical protein
MHSTLQLASRFYLAARGDSIFNQARTRFSNDADSLLIFLLAGVAYDIS